MWTVPPPENEERRLARLAALRVMDTEPEPLFDHLTSLAAQLCDTPVALLGLIDKDRQWFKARIGFGRDATPRKDTFCAHTLLADGLFEVRDARVDPRFERHPDVIAESGLCFYAGVPIRLDDGSHPGTLCVVDFRPRELTDAQREALTRLADSIAEGLMMRERLLARPGDDRGDEPHDAHDAPEVHEAPTAEHSEPAEPAEPADPTLAEALAARRDSEQRFRTLGEVAPLGIYHTDAAGHCLYTNAAWQRVYGLGAAASLGAGWLNALHPDDCESVRDHWHRCLQQGRPFEMRYRVLRPGAAGGALRQLWSRARPLKGPDGRITGYVGVAEDVTERLTAERDLRESQALLDRTGRVAGIGGWSLDLLTQELVWSDQTCRIHDLEPGYQPSVDEAISYYNPEARDAIEAALEQGIQEGRAWSLELPLTTAKGRQIWVLSQGQADVKDGVPVRLVGAFQDVTEQHRAAVELEQSRQRLRALYESTPALMHSVDTAGRVLSVSNRWLERMGYRREQVIGRLLDDFMTPETSQQVREVFRPAMWRDGHVSDCAVQLICADGRLRDVLVSAVAEYDADGRPLRALALVDDITEELKHRAELAQEQRMRRQIERHVQELDQLLHERSEMLDVLAHEVRQPLNNASAALQSATASLAGRGERQAQERLTRAQAVLGQVLAGVDNTLAASSLLAGGGRLARQDTDIDTLIAVSIADLPRDQRDRILVRRHTATRTALMDMNLMRLALRNLLSNALKHAPGATPVTLDVMDFDEPPALQFEVADAGPGIPREVLPRLFTRGARGHGGPEPTHGLGLYIVKRVMDLHGGSAELLRTGPLGTVMRLTLPQAG